LQTESEGVFTIYLHTKFQTTTYSGFLALFNKQKVKYRFQAAITLLLHILHAQISVPESKCSLIYKTYPAIFQDPVNEVALVALQPTSEVRKAGMLVLLGIGNQKVEKNRSTYVKKEG
jgi:hypothetical protein